MTPAYSQFVDNRKSKTAAIDLNLHLFDELYIDAAQVNRLTDDLKRHLFYGTPLKAAENINRQGRESLVTTIPDEVNTVHAILGLVTESLELLERLHKDLRIETGVTDFDKPNYLEEIGDLYFYITMLLMAMGFSHEQVIQANVDKLTRRYPDGFSYNAAVNRDADAEREILEQHAAA